MRDYLPFFPSSLPDKELSAFGPDALAFVGDAVQTLFVRSEAAAEIKKKTAALHRSTAEKVKAVSQAVAVKNILFLLTPEEDSVYKRARNMNSGKAKNAPILDYREASGFEGLIGWLYLKGEHDRLNELLRKAYSED
jgi:Uncharacterized protein conserved in bacteria